ncbi:MAG: DNA primase [Candidatus Omnitrophica bacterium]|nr:DNA primase [Candidatus Omnitrophota bacterium]
MNYDDSIKDEVRLASNIVDVISQVVSLKKSGRNFKANCPFHQEKSPSFMVHPEKQIFRCFGCGVGGDVFTFLMKHENLTFPEALRQLAERANIQLPVYSAQNREKASESEALYEICQFAADFYHQTFFHPIQGKTARDYFFKRGYTEEVAREFKIGWAPEGWHFLFEALSKKGFSEALLLKSGLIQKSPKGSLYDAFRARLLFPIHNLQGKIVAFGGRILTDQKEGPKYLNSPETPIFHKRRELFGLHLAKKNIPMDRSQILVTEGYFDFLRLYHQGFKHVVATLGTSLTEEHVQLLKRFADEAVVIYDGDKAGQAASLRGLEVFLEGEMSVKLVRMPQGLDPDDYLVKEGNAALQKMIDEAKDFLDFKLEILFERYNPKDSLGLMRITGELIETLQKVNHPVLLDHYLTRIASRTGISRESLKSEWTRLKQKQKSRPGIGSDPGPSLMKTQEISDEEVILLSLLIDEREIRKKMMPMIHEMDFESILSQNLFREIVQTEIRREEKSWPQWLDSVTEDGFKQSLIRQAEFEWNLEEKEKAARDCFWQLRKKKKEKKLSELRRLILDSEHSRDHEKMQLYARDYQELLKKPLEVNLQDHR